MTGKCAILLPVYNGERYLQQTIESVISQTYKNWDLLIYDDGSTDSSLEILGKYSKNKNIKIFKGEINKGCGQAFNFLFNKAKDYDFIGMLGQDDVFAWDFIEKQIECLKKTDCIVAFSQVNYINQLNNFIDIDMYDHDVLQGKSRYDIFYELLKRNFLCATSSLINMQKLRDKNIYRGANNDRWQDHELWLTLIMFGHFFYNKETSISYRKHDFNLSSAENRIIQYKLEFNNMLLRLLFSSDFKDFIDKNNCSRKFILDIVSLLFNNIEGFDNPFVVLTINFCELVLSWGIEDDKIWKILNKCYFKTGLLQKSLQNNTYKKILIPYFYNINDSIKNELLETNLFEQNKNIGLKNDLREILITESDDLSQVEDVPLPAIIYSNRIPEGFKDNKLILNHDSDFVSLIMHYVQDDCFLYNNCLFSNYINPINNYKLLTKEAKINELSNKLKTANNELDVIHNSLLWKLTHKNIN